MNLSDLIGHIENADPQPLRPRKVLVWGRNQLLVRAIGSYLEGMTWEVIRVTQDVEGLVQEIQRVHPQVVILCQDKADDDPLLPGRLVDERHCLKVVTVGLDSNLMHVYSKQNIILQGASDLLSIMEPASTSDCAHEKEVASTNENTEAK